MPSNYLLNDDHVVRYVPWAKLRKDEDDIVIGCLPSAFLMRDEEDYLSVTWCEYYQGTPDQRRRCAIEALRNSYDCRPKGQFAHAEIGPIRLRAEARPNAKKLRIIHEPEPDNPAHAAIRHWPRDDIELLDLLAAVEWSDLITATQADALPKTECQKSGRS